VIYTAWDLDRDLRQLKKPCIVSGFR
jgi:hypothetical protein